MKGILILTGVLTAAILFPFKTTDVFAATPAKDRSFLCSFPEPACSYCGSGCSFVDENGDGICDFYGCPAGQGYTDEDGNGVCDYYDRPAGQGYTDQNGDGICDNFTSGRCGGYGGGQGRRGGGRGCRRR